MNRLRSTSWGRLVALAAVAVLFPGTDAVQAESLLDQWNIHPRYTTSYNVNRTRQTWSQGLNFRRKAGPLNLSNVTNMVRTTNSAQNNYEEQRGSNAFKLDTAWDRWTFGLDVGLKRDSSDNDFSKRRNNDANANLRLETQINPPLLHQIRLTGTGGYALENDLSERNQGGALGVRSDSTVAKGLTWGLDLATGGAWGEDVTYTANSNFSGANQESETFSTQGGEDLAVRKDPNDDSQRQLQARVAWDPSDEWKGEVRGRHAFNRNETFDFEVEETETKEGISNSIDAQVEGPLHSRVVLKAELGTALTDIDYRVKAQDNYKRVEEGLAQLSYEPPFLFLESSKITGKFEVRNSRKEPQTSRSNDVRERIARFVVERPIGAGVRVQGTTEISLRQEIYDDALLDKDEVRTLWDGAFTYSSGARFSARISFQRTDTEIINLRATQASSNNTVQRNRVSARYDYDFKFPMRVTQIFNVSADYTYFTFNDANNTLRRTNEVKTEIASDLAPNTVVEFEHLYRFGDSGDFSLPGGGGAALYAPSAETLRQFLVLATEYNFRQILFLKASQSFDARTTTTLATNRARVTERVEFAGEARLKHTFSEDFNLEGSFRQTQSNTEDDYWIVEAKLDRAF